jgi:aminopeptidase 2
MKVLPPLWVSLLSLTSESLATFKNDHLLNPRRLFPEWGAKMGFINSHLERALELDARRSSHPIEVPCDDAKKVNQIFDALSYSKAGSGKGFPNRLSGILTHYRLVLRMLSDFVTEEKFLEGVVRSLLYVMGRSHFLLVNLPEEAPLLQRAYNQSLGGNF